MRSLRIFYKLFISHTAIGLLSVLIISFLLYTSLREALIQRTVDQLSSINILKKNQLENYLFRTQKNLLFLIRNTSLTTREEINQVGQQVFQLRQLYEFDNISLLDSKMHHVYSASPDTSFLSIVNARHLLDSTEDFRQNPFYIMDVSAFNPQQQTLLLYIIPLSNNSHQSTGFILVKENFAKLQKILFERTGMGNTGETYFIAKDSLLRSASRFFPNSPPLSIKVTTQAMEAFNGSTDKILIKDYRGEDVLSIHRLIEFRDLQWIIVSEIDIDEAMRSINQLKNYFIWITLLIILIILVITYFISNAISKPILKLKERIISLSKGEFPADNFAARHHDEIGQIITATNQLIDALHRTSVFANEIGSGNFNASFAKLGEKDSLGTSLLSMRDKLKAFNERELRLVREKGAALMEGQENERKRIIRELHDGIGQLLTVVKLRLEAMEGQEDLKKEITHLVNETIAEVRRISYNVMPNALVDFGLEAALKGLCENIKRYSGLEIDFTYVKESDQSLNFEISIAVFRIVQEGLNNIIKHAKATQVALYVVENEDRIYFVVKDNGIGFSKEKIYAQRGFGLTSMKERAKLLNGDVEIQSTTGEGTVVEVHIPIQRDQS